MPPSQWTQVYAPVGGSLLLSFMAAALPIVVVGMMLGVWRAPAWRASLAALLTALTIAVVVYGMPAGLALATTGYGAAFGLLPIGWLVFSAILLFDVTVEAGCLGAIEQSIRMVSDDHRVLVLLIAFAFGAFIEGTSGFGTPVAVSAALLVAIGLPAFEAAGLCLVANTAPVAFGALATPIVTLAGVTGLPLQTLSAAVGRLCPIIAVAIPMYLLMLLAGRKAAVDAWPAALVCGVTFAVAQFAVSNYIGPYLTDIVAALASVFSLLLLVRFWKPRTLFRLAAPTTRPSAEFARSADMSMLRAWSPYLLLVVLVVAWGNPWVARQLDLLTIRLNVPTLHNAILRSPPVTAASSPYAAVYAFTWLSSAGTACFIAAALAALVTGLGPAAFGRVILRTGRRLLVPELTIASVLALAYVMNYSGATATLGLGMAQTGVLFPFFSAFLGWLGVFLTGSDTSSNALFGNLQIISARALGLNPILMAAVNSTAGVLGKMVSIQSIAVATAATGMSRESEGKLFLFTLKHSLGLTAIMGLLALLFSYVLTNAIPSA